MTTLQHQETTEIFWQSCPYKRNRSLASPPYPSTQGYGRDAEYKSLVPYCGSPWSLPVPFPRLSVCASFTHADTSPNTHNLTATLWLTQTLIQVWAQPLPFASKPGFSYTCRAPPARTGRCHSSDRSWLGIPGVG